MPAFPWVFMAFGAMMTTPLLGHPLGLSAISEGGLYHQGNPSKVFKAMPYNPDLAEESDDLNLFNLKDYVEEMKQNIYQELSFLMAMHEANGDYGNNVSHNDIPRSIKFIRDAVSVPDPNVQIRRSILPNHISLRNSLLKM